MKTLFLASTSPRRRDLLAKAGIPFSLLPLKVSEIPDKNLNVNQQICDIAYQKVQEARRILEKTPPFALPSDFLVLTADTMVVFEDQVLGKPETTQQAVEFLQNLSGRIHLVKTGIVLFRYRDQKIIQRLDTTEVHFRKLSQNEILDYVATGEPMDKAGAYGIQGAGGTFVEKYQGDFENVMGLSTKSVIEMLQEMGEWN